MAQRAVFDTRNCHAQDRAHLRLHRRRHPVGNDAADAAVLDRIGFDEGAVIGCTTMVLAFLMVFFGVKSYRDQTAGGSVSLGRAFCVGLLITLVASACYVATWQVVHYGFAPDFGDKYAAHVVDNARRAGATEAQIAAKTQEMKEMKEFNALYKNPLINIGPTFLEPLPDGLTFTLVTAFVLSRKRLNART